MSSCDVALEASWKEALLAEFAKPYMQKLRQFLRQEKQQQKTIYPKGSDIFQAFALTPLDKVRVVILGQDPYHGPRQAHGLCFSVAKDVAIPPSLVNIYKELQADLGITPAKHGFLQHWAEQGVLLLNSVLTVVAGQAGSHQNKGWEQFTDQVVATLNALDRPIVFVLWGSYAVRKGNVIDSRRHVVLTAPHPSPLSAHRGFLGCRHFSKINAKLVELGQEPIDWQLPA